SQAADARTSVKMPTDIPPEPLGRALQSLAKERNLVLAYRSEVVGNARTEGASGDLTRDEALRQLLRGTGLTYRFLDEKTVTILSASSSSVGVLVTHLPMSSSSSASGNTAEKEGKRSSSTRFRLA